MTIALEKEKFRSKFLEDISAMENLKHVPEELKQDVLLLYHDFPLLSDDPREAAYNHPEYSSKVMWAASQLEGLLAAKEVFLEKTRGELYLAAREVLIDEGVQKPSKDHIEAVVNSEEEWYSSKIKVVQLRVLKTFVDNLRWALKDRANMIKILSYDSDYDS